MKKLFLSTVVLLGIVSGSARAHAKPARDFETVPLTSWVYPALDKMNRLGHLVYYPPTETPPRAMIRYEVALAMVRHLDKGVPVRDTPQELVIRDIVAILCYEFYPEILQLNEGGSLDGRAFQINRELLALHAATKPSEWFNKWRNIEPLEKRISLAEKRAKDSKARREFLKVK